MCVYMHMNKTYRSESTMSASDQPGSTARHAMPNQWSLTAAKSRCMPARRMMTAVATVRSAPAQSLGTYNEKFELSGNLGTSKPKNQTSLPEIALSNSK